MNFQDYGIDISKIRGSSGKTTCPRCSKDRRKKTDPSLSVDLAQGLFNCHHCGWKGSINKVKHEVQYVRPKMTNTTALSDKTLKWFTDRGITQETLNTYKITEGMEWMPQTQKEMRCIQFPYYRGGELVNVKFRDGAKNFKMWKGAELILFNLDSLEGQTEAIITEGEIDALTYLQNGYKCVLSVPNGATKGGGRLDYLDGCIEALNGLDKIYLATDDDEAGRALRDELARRLGVERCYKVQYFGNKDVNDLMQKDPLQVEETINQAQRYPVEGVFTSTDILDEIYDLKINGLKAGKTISIDGFNRLLTFETGYVTAITGIPGHGKSDFCDQIMVDTNAQHGWKWAMFSPENYPLQLHFSKIARKLHGKHFNDFTKFELDEAVRHFSENFYFVMPDDDLSLDNILSKVKTLVHVHGVNGFIIDAWNKLEHNYSDSEHQHISRSLDQIDAFCRKYNVHCLIVAHPKKIERERDTGRYRVPNMYDISGSSNWYNKCANGIVVYRDFSTNEVTIHVPKVKFAHWGEGGEVRLHYHKPSGRYFETTMNTGSLIVPSEPVKQSVINAFNDEPDF